MKFSLISATSIFALISASFGPAHATVVTTTPAQQSVYDFVHDGLTSSDGGDVTVSRQDPGETAVIALESATGGLQAIGFTGRADQSSLSGHGYPQIPLGAAPGTQRDDNFASAAATWQMDALQKSRTVGQDRMASLIGTVGSGSSSTEKNGNTVFVQAGSTTGFRDAGTDASGPGGVSVAYAFAPGSSSTATITVAGAANLSRQFAGGTSYAIAANSLQMSSPVVAEAQPTVAMSDTAQQTLGYTYTPASASAAKGTAVEASFSDAVTATGNMAQVVTPIISARVQISQLQPGQATSGRFQTSQAPNRAGRKGEIQTSQTQRALDGGTAGKTQTSEAQLGPTMPGQSVTGTVQTSDAQARRDDALSGQMQQAQFQSLDIANNGKLQTSQVEPDQGRSDRYLTSQIQQSQFRFIEAANAAKLGDPGQILDPREDTQGDGTRTLISTSVAVNPTETAALYLANVIRQAPTGPTTQTTIEAFEIGPVPGTKTQASAAKTISDPLGAKIMASAGALDNSLALP